MTFTIQLTPEDYIQAIRVHQRPRPALKWIGYLLIALALLVAGVSFGFALVGRDSFVGSIFIMALLVYFAVVFLVFQPARLRRIYSQQKAMQIPYLWAVTDDEILVKSEISDEKLPWNHFIRWKEGKNLFMLYQSDAAFRLLPKRCFASPEEIMQFRQLLQTKLGIEN